MCTLPSLYANIPLYLILPYHPSMRIFLPTSSLILFVYLHELISCVETPLVSVMQQEIDLKVIQNIVLLLIEY
jgi:hypothetical protein